MDTSEIAASYAALPADEQAEVLSLLALELTIAAREWYEPGDAGLSDASRVRALNEVQHRVTSHLAALLRGDAGRYPCDVLTAIVLDGASDPQLGRIKASAFARALNLAAQHA